MSNPEADNYVVKPKKPKPTHYKVVCLSLYSRDIELLDELVAACKARGWSKASKSAVVRLAISKLYPVIDVTVLPSH
jgi:hypothetical protein